MNLKNCKNPKTPEEIISSIVSDFGQWNLGPSYYQRLLDIPG